MKSRHLVESRYRIHASFDVDAVCQAAVSHFKTFVIPAKAGTQNSVRIAQAHGA
jgi:hypothetical protein